MIKSNIPNVNAQARIDVPEEQLANESKIRLKRGRPIGSKDINPRKRITHGRIDTLEEVHDKQSASIEAYDKQKVSEEVHDEQEAQEALAEAYIEQKTPKEIQNKEISLKRHKYLKITRSQ